MNQLINLSKLVELRKSKKMTQKDMAKVLQIETITYSQKEQGVINITVKDLALIKKHFKIKVDTLFEN